MNFNQYKVDENGVGTPVNIHPTSDRHGYVNKQWLHFNQWAQDNTIQTVGVEPGVYPVGAFKRDHFRFWDGSQWYKISDDEFFSDDYSRYEPFNEFESLVGSVYTLKEETPADNKESVEEAAKKYSDEWRYDMRPMWGYSEIHFKSGAKWQVDQPNPELTRLKALVEKYEKALPKWISVKSDLPEIGKCVLVFLKSGLITCAHRDKKHGVNTWELYGDIAAIYDLKTESVTHWMPLPEPPQIDTNALKSKS